VLDCPNRDEVTVAVGFYSITGLISYLFSYFLLIFKKILFDYTVSFGF